VLPNEILTYKAIGNSSLDNPFNRMATTANNSNRLLTGVVGAIVLNLLLWSVHKCNTYKSASKMYQDSLNYYKVESAQRCQMKIDSLQHFIEKLDTRYQQKTNDLNAATPSWLR